MNQLPASRSTTPPGQTEHDRDDPSIQPRQAPRPATSANSTTLQHMQ